MVRSTVLSDNNKDWFTLLLFFISIVGIFFGSISEVKGGIIYLTMTLVGLAFIFLVMIYYKETDKKELKKLFKTPFVGDTEVSMMGWVFGWITIIVINIIGFFTQSFSTTQFFSSIYLSGSNSISAISQSFSAGVIENTPLGIWFYSVFVAGTIEELVWSLALPLILFIIFYGMVETFFKGKKPFGFNKRKFAMFLTIIGSVITFSLIHQTNSSYVGIMFIIAGLFRLILNTLTYSIGFIISFVIGMHQSNNNLAYIQQFGFATFIEALFGSLLGGIFAVLLVGIFVYVLWPSNFVRIWKKFKLSITSYRF